MGQGLRNFNISISWRLIMENMKQCKLTKGRSTLTSWIPEKFAQIGNVLKVEEDEGWIVQKVGGTLSKERVKTMEMRFRNKSNFQSIK